MDSWQCLRCGDVIEYHSNATDGRKRILEKGRHNRNYCQKKKTRLNLPSELDLNAICELRSEPEIDDIISEPNLEVDVISKVVASQEILQFQKSLLSKYSDILDKTMSRRNGSEHSWSVEDLLAINNARVETNLSPAQALVWIRSFEGILKRKNICNVPLPKKFQTITTACNDGLIGSENDVHKLCSFEWSFEKVDERFKNHFPKSQVYYCYDICEVIGEALLHCSSHNFIRDPDNNRLSTAPDGSVSRMLEDYTTCDHFTSATQKLREETNDKNSVFLGIQVRQDETTCRSMKRSATPMAICILNCIDEDFKCLLLGYIPDCLPYTDAEIKDIFRADMNITGQGVTDDTISLLKRQLKFDYMEFALQKILRYQISGLEVSIGFDKSTKNERVYPHIVNYSSDNMELDDLATTHFKSSTRKCRICMEKDCTDNLSKATDPEREIRCSDDTLQQSSDGMLFLLDKLFAGKDNEQRRAFNRNRFDEHGRHKSLNLRPCNNPLPLLMKWQSDRELNNFHRSLLVDNLHTINEGVMKHLVICFGDILQCVSRLDPAKYKSNMSRLDEVIRIFPANQSLLVDSRGVRFTNLSKQFNKLASTKQQSDRQSGGFVGFEGWKWPIATFQILFSINDDILPMSYTDFSANNDKRINLLSVKWNPGRILINAFYCMLDFYYRVSSKVSNVDRVNKLAEVVTNLRAHLVLVWWMRKDFLLAITKDKQGIETGVLGDAKAFDGIKQHLLVHFQDQMLFYHLDPRGRDTEILEHFHKEAYKDIFQLSSKRYDPSNREILLIFKRRHHSKMLMAFQTRDGREATSEATNPAPVTFAWDISITKGKQMLKRNDLSSKLASFILNRNVLSINSLVSMFTASDADSDYIYSINDKEDFVNLFWKSEAHDVSFVESISFRNRNTAYSEDNFTVKCNSKVAINKGKDVISNCHFVIVENPDDNSQQQVVEVCAIFDIVNSVVSNQNHDLFLLVVSLQEVTQASPMPFPLFKYDWKPRTHLTFSIIPVASVKCPVCMIPYCTRGNLWSDNNQSSKLKPDEFNSYLKAKRFACIQSSFLDSSHGLNFEAYNKNSQSAGPGANLEVVTARSRTSLTSAANGSIDSILNDLQPVWNHSQLETISKFLKQISDDLLVDHGDDEDGD